MTETIKAYETFEAMRDAWLTEDGPLEPVQVWVTPGRSITIHLPTKNPPKMLVSALVRDEETNKFFARPLAWPFLIRADTLKKKLGWELSQKILRRLALAGEIRMATVTPQVHMVDLASLYAFLKRVECDDSDHYWRGERLARYSEARSIIK